MNSIAKGSELLRLLDDVVTALLAGRDAGESATGAWLERLGESARQTAACAAALAFPETERFARDLAMLADSLAAAGGDPAELESGAEQLQMAAETELARSVSSPAPQSGVAAASETEFSADNLGMPVADFVSEAREHLGMIEQLLLRLEQDTANPDPVHGIFRSFHTIKGLAAIAGLEGARELAHLTETLLDLVRENRVAVSAPLVDTVLASADALARVVDTVEAGGPTLPAPDEALLDALIQAIENGPDNAGAQTDPGALRQQQQPQLQVQTQPAGTAAGSARREGSQAIVKVDTEKLDHLVDMVGELVIAQSLVQLDPAVQSLKDPKTGKNLSQLGRITSELQKTAMALRVVPIGQVFQRMSRVFRDVLRTSGKEATLELSGEDAELDRTIVEQLADPLLHMVRNALDHGLEPPSERIAAGKPRQGRVRLSASHHSGHILVEVTDDGRGIDPERIFRKAVERGLVAATASLTTQETLDLIFEPGFSTSQVVTELSGRGVGMDVVKKAIERLRGRVEIRSELGHGTCFQMRVPLTLAIIDALVVRSGRERYIVPLFAVREIISGGSQTLQKVEGRHEVTLVREHVIPVLRLDSLLGRPRLESGTRDQVLVIAEVEGKRFGLSVDEVIGKQQVVIKSLGDWLGRLRGIAGGAILGDGSVGIILDLNGLVAKESHALSA